MRQPSFEPWDTFMSSPRSIPLIIDTEVKVALSFSTGWHPLTGGEKRRFFSSDNFNFFFSKFELIISSNENCRFMLRKRVENYSFYKFE